MTLEGKDFTYGQEEYKFQCDPHHGTILDEYLVEVSSCEGLIVDEKLHISSEVYVQDKTEEPTKL